MHIRELKVGHAVFQRTLANVALAAMVASCSASTPEGGAGAGGAGAGGAAGSGQAGTAGVNGSPAGMDDGSGGARAAVVDSGNDSSEAAGGINAGGFGGAMADATASGGNNTNGGADANQDGHSDGMAGNGGGGSDGGPSGFVCNQVTAMTLTREWFEAGFETANGIIDAKWQLKAREHGYITEWSNPNSTFWNEKPESPCSSGSTNPDHVVLTVLSWVPACCTTQSEWGTQVEGAVSNLKAKYSALKRINLMTVIRGPGNTRCPADPTAGETIAMPPELDAALAATATKFPGLVFVAPKFEAANCSAFSGGGPHLTTAGNTAVAKDIAAYFAKLQ